MKPIVLKRYGKKVKLTELQKDLIRQVLDGSDTFQIAQLPANTLLKSVHVMVDMGCGGIIHYKI